MRVRCGRCRSELEVPGPGRHTCPVCGVVNEVREAQDSSNVPWTPPPPPPPAAPSPRISCGECQFSFIVGQVETAICPNCGSEVKLRAGGGSTP